MNLVPLFEEAIEFQNYNGSVLSNGKVAVFYIGRTRLADIFNDIEGLSPAENPKVLDNLGMGPLYVNPAFDYEIIVYDAYDNEMFSVKKYLHSKGEHSTANVVVTPSENIAVSAWTIGDVQVYMPYLTGDVGKTYEGIDPIVVNNEYNRISANHIPLGVQDPLYFVEDSESACIIGIDSSACGKTYSGISPILVDNTANTISITGDIGKDWTEEILSAANDASAAATAWTDSQGYLTGVDLSGYAKESFVISAIDSATSGLFPSSAVNGIFNSVFANTVYYSNKPTAFPIQASQNDLVNVGKIIGQNGSNFYIVPSGVLQIPNIITAATDGLTAHGLFVHTSYGLSANGITAAYYNSGFSAMGISAGKNGPLCIEGQYETISATGGSGFTFSSQNTAFGTAQLTTAYGNQLVQMTAPKFEARNISGAGFSIEASGAKGYNESGNVVWDTNNPQVKNIICYNDTLTATGGLTGSIILTVQPSTTTSNLTSSPYVIMDASQASYFAAYGPSAQTPTIKLKPDAITFDYAAGNAKTTVGYNNIKQESGGSAWTLTGSIQKRELEYDTATSAITAIAGSAIGGDCGGSALPISAGHGIKFEMIDNTLVASVTSTPTSGYVWQSASLFHTDTPETHKTTYTLSDNCSNYDRLDVDFYDVNHWRTVMECPIPSNLDASGTRGGYFSVVPANTGTGADIWFKAFNWTASGNTWTCYCSELAGKGGSTTQTINANQPNNPPQVVNIIGWKRVGGN